MIAETRIGSSQAVPPGAIAEAAGGQFGQPLTGDISAKYQEAVRKGNCFIAVDTTVRLLDAPDATPVGMTLANPTTSTKNLVLLYAAGCHNGTALTAAGVVMLTSGASKGTEVTTGTAVTIRNCLIGSAANSIAVASVAATVPTTGVALYSLGVALTGSVATTIWAPVLGGFLDGAIIVAPGGYINFNSTVTLTGAGGGIINTTLAWEEIPV